MLRDVPDTDKITVDVYTREGEDYIGKDAISDSLLSEYESVISFWADENTVMVIPVDKVEHVVIHIGKDEEEESVEDSDDIHN